MAFASQNLLVHILAGADGEPGIVVYGSCTGCTCTNRPLSSCHKGTWTVVTPAMANAVKSAELADLQALQTALADLQSNVATQLDRLQKKAASAKTAPRARAAAAKKPAAKKPAAKKPARAKR